MLVKSVITCIFLITSVYCQSNRVKFHDIPPQTFRAGHLTNGRRSTPIQQITCISGYGKPDCSKGPTEIRCEIISKIGLSEAQFKCIAILPSGYKMSNYVVSCEGYDYPDDPYILEGSCGVEYTLELSKENEKIPSKIIIEEKTETTTTHHNIPHPHVIVTNYDQNQAEAEVAMIIFCGILATIAGILIFALCVDCCQKLTSTNTRTSTTSTTVNNTHTHHHVNDTSASNLRQRHTTTTSSSGPTYVQQPQLHRTQPTYYAPSQPTYVPPPPIYVPPQPTYVSSYTSTTPIYVPVPVNNRPVVINTVTPAPTHDVVEKQTTTKTTIINYEQPSDVPNSNTEGSLRIVEGTASTRKR